jgi:uncharacterized protein YacL
MGDILMRRYLIRASIAVSLAAVGALILGLTGLKPGTSVIIGFLLAVATFGLQIGAEKFSLKAFSVLMIGLVIGVIMSFLVRAILGGLPDTVFGGKTDTPEEAKEAARVADRYVNWAWGISLILFTYFGIIVANRGASQFNMFTPEERASSTGKGPYRIVVDTSVIIDGRLADIGATGFIEGQLIIPRFVLKELQTIADSSDHLKRARGRRGLDMLNRIQKDPNIDVVISEEDFPRVREVDAKLIQLAKKLEAKIFTNDYNLNKLAEFQQVRVLNINDLSNALKPVILPGEVMTVRIVREGKEPGQGVAYLDDGTMVVINDGKDRIGQKLDVGVTSVLQKPAGRMIFAEIK